MPMTHKTASAHPAGEPESLGEILPRERRTAVLTEARRVLRDGGRCVAIEPSRRGVLASLVGRPAPDTGDLEGALATAGFRAVRTLAEREGMAFIEGARRR